LAIFNQYPTIIFSFCPKAAQLPRYCGKITFAGAFRLTGVKSFEWSVALPIVPVE
jgi:hypothetical protein